MGRKTFRIYYPKGKAERSQWNKRFGLNAYYSGKPWPVRKRDADFWHLVTISAINKHGMRNKPFENPVEISFLWNDRLDIDNHAVMGKMITDAMKGRIIHDDSRRWLKAVHHGFHDEDYIRVDIWEV